MIYGAPLAITDEVLLSTNVPEDEYTEWDNGETYITGERVQVAETHEVFESAVAGNIGHDPLDDVAQAYWLRVGATNPYRMYDDRHSTQTTNPDLIYSRIQAVGIIDTVAIVNTDAASVRIVMTDAIEGVVRDETFDLIDHSGVIDAYTYAFNPIVRERDKAIITLPPYANAQIEIYIAAPGETVRCGSVTLALKVEMGGTLWGASLQLQDTSIKTRDEWGEYYFVERPFYKSVDVSVWVPTASISYLQNQLAQYRATPILWILDPDVGAGIGLAIYEDLVFVLSEADLSLCTLRLGMLI